MKNNLLLSQWSGYNPFHLAAQIIHSHQITLLLFSNWILPRLCFHQKITAVLQATGKNIPSGKISGSLGHFAGGNVPLSWWLSHTQTPAAIMSVFSFFVPFSLLCVCFCLTFSLTNSVCFCHSLFFFTSAKLLSPCRDKFPPAMETPILKRMWVYR